MKIKIKADDLIQWKKEVNAICSICSKSSANESESCIYIESTINTEDELKSYCLFKIVENGSHKLTYQVKTNIEVLESGSCYIKAKAFLTMSKAINTTVELKIENGQLSYQSDNLGTISESLFHNQEAFNGIMDIKGKEINLVNQYNSKAFFVGIAKVIALCSNFPYILLKFKKDSLSIYGQYALSGFLKYEIRGNFNFIDVPEEEYSIALKISTFKVLLTLNSNELNISGSITSPKYLTLTTDTDNVILFGNDQTLQDYLSIDYFAGKEKLAELFLSKKELTDAISWQSYGTAESDTIALSCLKPNLLIKETKKDKEAKVGYYTNQEVEDFKLTHVPVKTLTNALKSFNGTDLVKISQVQQEINNKVIKLLFVQPGNIEEEFLLSVMLYEQRLLTR